MAAERMRKMLMANTEFYDPSLSEIDARFGPVPNIPVGAVFDDRRVHAPSVAGIAGTAKDGAFSVCLSGGYKDDVDQGEFFIYTGTGGQEDSFGKSAETRRPVRVVRGPNVHSKYAPARGYRYDGLYVVERAYMGKSKDGYAICQYELRRVPGQPPLPVNPNYR
ncbi:hypothetical protein HYPSUDRAFT_1066652 [Hypholoma sublateritium FD-334 SS-4]|uniref:YDG domain-containing protein n=1 Tax=Hypholoma sublateritium (strain FD-334 SS-4) TaxID=945553 RepID=A0A0D2NGT8_HYPSF|nr:hypothetical protein HYPSUDRAFT_1066652 [Hypholoma sublateritium FD-334 SS-4]